MFFGWFKKNSKNHGVNNDSSENIAIKKQGYRKQVGIRLEAIGGQGAHSAGKILSEAAVLGELYTGNHFSSFGSEKRGTHVRSFVRFSTSQKPVRTASAIRNPDILVIFHEQLIFSHPEIFDGCTDQTDIILNTRSDFADVKLPENIKFRKLILIDAEKYSLKYNCRVNAVLLGVLSAFMPEVSVKNVKKYLDLFFNRLSDEKRRSNLEGFLAGADKLNEYSYEQVILAKQHSAIQKPEWGWMDAPIGGVILEPGNSYLKDNSASRSGFAPVLNRDLCFDCGFCDMVCPDFCFVWEIDPSKNKKPKLQGIDYQYCKGCQKCVTVCPVQALEPTPEAQITDDEKQYKVFQDANKK